MTTRPPKFAVLSPVLGAPSESFIRRHMSEIAPGQTTVIASTRHAQATWDHPGAQHVLSQPLSPMQRLIFRILRRTGLAPTQEVNWRLQKILRREKIELVLGEYLDVTVEYLPALRATGCRIFAHAHGYDVSHRLREPEWRKRYLELNTIDGVITMNHISIERLVALGVRRELIHYIPYGVDVPPAFVPRPKREQVHLIAVGRLTPKKAPLLLLQAFHLARQSAPALHLDLIGDGELRADVERTIVELGLANHVTLHGAQPHAFVLEAFQRADLFVQHSMTDPETGDEEGLPVAILEAMAAGLPVVSTRHAGIPDAVQHESNGLLVPEGDVTGMAQAITTLALDETKRQAMGQTGHQRALTHFSAQQEITALQKLLGL